MNIFLYLDRGLDWWAKQLMKAAKFFGIDQATAVRGYVVITAHITPGYLLLSAFFYRDESVTRLIVATIISIFHYFLFIGPQLKEVEEMIRDLERMETERARPSGILWSWGYQLILVVGFEIFCVAVLFFWPSQHDSDSFRWFVWMIVPLGLHLYLMRHYDIGTKTTCKGLIKSGWAKVAGLFAPKPVPVPQPSG